jgi:stage II sporulation protein D
LSGRMGLGRVRIPRPSTLIGTNDRKHRCLWGWVLLGVAACVGGCRPRIVVEPTPQMDIAESFQIRVLLFDKISECVLSSPSGFSATAVDVGADASFGTTSSDVQVDLLDGRIRVGGSVLGRRVEIRSRDPYILTINGERYRGNLTLLVLPDGAGLEVINTLPLEPYLAGVIGAEMPSYWETEALRAQTIASRTYSLYIKRRFGADRQWDVRRTQANQVYRGLSAESATIWEAIRATQGKVLTVRNSAGEDEIFAAYFSSTCAGHTENSQNVFGDRSPALDGVACSYCAGVSRRSFLVWPKVSIPVEQVNQRIVDRYPKLSELEGIATIEPTRLSEYPGLQRITQVRLTGPNGKTNTLRAEDLRLAIDPTGRKLKSACFVIRRENGAFVFDEGKGYGHGVGLCQYGAEGMAREGFSCESILQFYFPGSHLRQYY